MIDLSQMDLTKGTTEWYSRQFFYFHMICTERCDTRKAILQYFLPQLLLSATVTARFLNSPGSGSEFPTHFLH